MSCRQRLLLAVHHGTGPLQARRLLRGLVQMGRGKKQPWKDDSSSRQATFQLWRGSYSPQLRADAYQYPWRRGTANAPATTATAAFPTYTNMPPPAKDDPKVAATALAAQPPRGRVHGIQHLLNAARKAELKVHKLQAGKARREDQWEAFNKGLKESFLREQSRFQKDAQRTEQEIRDAVMEQEQAYQTVRAAFLGEPLPGEDSDMTVDTSEEQWDSMRASWAQEDDAYLRGIIDRAKPPAAAPQIERQLSPDILQMLSHFGAAHMAQLVQQSAAGLPPPAQMTQPQIGAAAPSMPMTMPGQAGGAVAPHNAATLPSAPPPPQAAANTHTAPPTSAAPPMEAPAGSDQPPDATSSPAGTKARRALSTGGLPVRKSVKTLPKAASPQLGSTAFSEKLALVREATALKTAAAAAGLHTQQASFAGPGHDSGALPANAAAPALGAEPTRALQPFGGTRGAPTDPVPPGTGTVDTSGIHHVPIRDDDTDSEPDKPMESL